MAAWTWRTDSVRRGLASGLGIGLICGLLGVASLISPWGRVAEQAWGLHWLFQLRGPLPAPQHVVVISLDRASAERFGFRQRPDQWPRAVHGDLVRRLHRAGARVIVFDLWFEQATRPIDDDAFAHAMAQAGNVLVLERLSKRTVSVDGVTPISVNQVHAPHSVFRESVLASGPFTLPKLPVAVSDFWTFDRNAGDAPSLATLAVLAAYPEIHQAVVQKVLQQTQTAAGGYSGARDLRSTVAAAFEVIHERCADTRATGCPLVGMTANPVAERIADLYLGPHSRVLNLYGPPQTIPTLPYWQAVSTAAAYSPSWLAAQVGGKVALVGVSSESQSDQADAFITPYSNPLTGHDIAGVEILATAIANLLDGTWLAVPDPIWQLLAVLVFGLIVGIVSRTLPPVLAVVTSVAFGGLWLWVALHAFTSLHVWTPTAVPLAVQLPAALLFGLWRQSLSARAERHRIGTAVSRYLPGDVVERMAHKGFHPDDDRQVVYGVCLNSDAERYTDFAESLAPEELARRVNHYYAALFEPVRRHGGQISDVVGDAMLALWTAPKERTALRRAACEAVRDILQAESAQDHGILLRTRIGLHAGEMVMSHVGAGDHFEYRAVGDTVNTSARLQALNKQLGTRCLASGETLSGIADVHARRVGRFRLRGKRRAIEVFALCLSPNVEFAAALALVEAGQWREAHERFAMLLTTHPHDGPVRFYVELAARNQQSPPDALPGEVVLDPDAPP